MQPRIIIYPIADVSGAAIHLITSAKNLAPEYRYLTIRLKLEQQRLNTWSSEVGLQKYIDREAEDLSPDLLGLNRAIVYETIYQIQNLVTDFIKYQKKFGVLVPDDIEPVGGVCMVNHMDDGSLGKFPDITNFLEKQARSLPFIKGLPKRLKWAAFHREKYERLISRLGGFNDVLIDLVDSNARNAIGQSMRESNATILHLHSKIDDLLQLFEALIPGKAITRPANLAAAFQPSSLSNAQHKRDLAGLAYFKAVNISIEKNVDITGNGQRTTRRHTQAFKIARSDIVLINDVKNIDGRCEANYRPEGGQLTKRVWVEWREYDPLMQVQPSLSPSRVDNLVSLLSEEHKPDLLRVPQCVGYFDSPRCKENNYRIGRLGFVFEKPSPLSASPISLRSLIELRTKPLLTERIALAKAIANCLMSLHSVNWLHKAICSQNIIFFPKDDYKIEYSTPYLSGFGYARPAFREDMTEKMSDNPEADMYRHPLLHGLGPYEGRQGFKRTFDIYSLGVVLVEIANWQAIEAVLRIEDPSTLSTSASKAIQSRLLGEECLLKSVGASAGERFRRATRNCLDSMIALGVGHLDDEMNVQVAAKVSKSFYHEVLLPLEEIQT